MSDHKPTGTESMVCDDIAARQRIGILKYGTTVTDNPLPLREWLEHAYQESLDLPIYLKRAIEEIDRENADLRRMIVKLQIELTKALEAVVSERKAKTHTEAA